MGLIIKRKFVIGAEHRKQAALWERVRAALSLPEGDEAYEELVGYAEDSFYLEHFEECAAACDLLGV